MSASSSHVTITNRLRAAGCVFAEEEAQLLITAAGTPADLAVMVDRRVAGLPLQHVLGWAEFCGFRIAIDPEVFVPRPRTELLVRQAGALARKGDVVVDLCCGSGAVGAAIAVAVPGVRLHATDIDPAAVRCARRNLAEVEGRVYEGDLYQPLPSRLRGRVNILVANAPYVPTEAIRLLPPEARIYENVTALDGGSDGLKVLRRIIAGAPQWLAPRGRLLFEVSEAQVPQAVQAVGRNGLNSSVARSYELEATVLTATRSDVPALHDHVDPASDPHAATSGST